MRRKLGFGIIALGALALLASKLLMRSEPFDSIRRSREAVLREDLFTMRRLLNQYNIDEHRRPDSLEDLIQSSYMKEIPVDPITKRNDTWKLERSKDPTNVGIVDIQSGSHSISTEGTAYDAW